MPLTWRTARDWRSCSKDCDHGLFGHCVADHHEPDQQVEQHSRDTLFMVRSCTHGDLWLPRLMGALADAFFIHFGSRFHALIRERLWSGRPSATARCRVKPLCHTHSYGRQRGGNPGLGPKWSIAPRIVVAECRHRPIPLILVCHRRTWGNCVERFCRHTIRDQFALCGRSFEIVLQTTLVQGGTVRMISAAGEAK
jgi:hypothetical protein